MSDANMALLLDLIRGDVLTLEAEHEGRPVVVRYRPAPAIKAAPRFPEGGGSDDISALDLLTLCADMTVSLTVDGQPAALGRAAITVRTFALLAALIPHIGAHAEAWMATESAPGGELIRRAERRAHGRAERWQT